MAKEKKIKILLVDDDELTRIYFRDIFWIHGFEKKYEILTADGPEEAEKIIQNPQTRPEIIFLDLIMPRSKGGLELTWETGLNLLKKIKKDPKLKKIKVVVYTGLIDDFVRSQVQQLGAEMYVVKGENLPKDVIELTEKIIQKDGKK